MPKFLRPIAPVAAAIYAAFFAAASPGTLSQQLDDYLSSRLGRSDFSGVVLVEKRGSILLDRGYGLADYESNVPNDDRRIYRIGSLSKPFTAVATMKLQEEGKLKIDDPLCAYLTACPPAWSPVSLRHLLSHTSGIDDYFSTVAAGPLSSMRQLIDAAIQAHHESPLLSPPGRTHRYNNFGFLLLGYVVEVAAKQPWETVLRTRVFDPAGMNNTAYDDVFAIVPGRARGYTRSSDGLHNIVYKDHGAFAAGGLRSTALDLLAWQHALVSGRILRRDSLDVMFTPVRDNYALGWQVMKFFDRAVIDHSGGIDGFASHLAFYPDEDLVIVVLSNVESEPAKTTACDLARIVFGSGVPVLNPAPVVELSPEVLDRFTGTFGDDEVTREIVRDGRVLYYVRAGSRSPLTALAPGRFVANRSLFLAFDASAGSFAITDGCSSPVATMRRR